MPARPSDDGLIDDGLAKWLLRLVARDRLARSSPRSIHKRQNRAQPETSENRRGVVVLLVNQEVGDFRTDGSIVVSLSTVADSLSAAIRSLFICFAFARRSVLFHALATNCKCVCVYLREGDDALSIFHFIATNSTHCESELNVLSVTHQTVVTRQPMDSTPGT